MTVKQNTAFVLGSNPALSIAEILAKTKIDTNSQQILKSNEVLILPLSINSPKFIDELGGTIKIVKILEEIPVKNFKIDEIVSNIAKAIAGKSQTSSKKFHLGISIYNLNSTQEVFNRLVSSLRYLYKNTKKESKKLGVKVAFINAKSRALSSASVIENDLTTPNGIEIILLSSPHTIFLGETIAVQDISAYTHFDVGRPVRDLVSGTIPPKLAKIMINLAHGEKDAVMLDPFCGSGTILQEMILLGYKNISGSDISEEAIRNTKKNIGWLSSQNNFDTSKIDIKTADALELSKTYKEKSIDRIVSEVYLGPALKNPLGADALNSLVDELSKMYEKILMEMANVINDDGVIVLALPAYYDRDKTHLLNITSGIERAGLQIAKLPSVLDNSFDSYITERESIIYSRPDQLVQREIIVINKIK